MKTQANVCSSLLLPPLRVEAERLPVAEQPPVAAAKRHEHKWRRVWTTHEGVYRSCDHCDTIQLVHAGGGNDGTHAPATKKL